VAVSIHCNGTLCHVLTRLLAVVNKNSISDCARTEASPYVRHFGVVSSSNFTTSLNEYEAKPPAMLNQTPRKKYIYIKLIG
jgi:hypothetical protein